MSLILDALKRAERERQLGQTPTPLGEVTPPPSPPPGNRNNRGPVIAVIAVLVAALAAFAWLRSGSAPTEAAADVASTALPEAPIEAPPAAEPVADPVSSPVDGGDTVSAQIEDDASIASLDDLTGDTTADATADDALVPVESEASEVAAVEPVAPGPTLYTPSRPPEPVAQLSRAEAGRNATSAAKPLRNDAPKPGSTRVPPSDLAAAPTPESAPIALELASTMSRSPANASAGMTPPAPQPARAITLSGPDGSLAAPAAPSSAPANDSAQPAAAAVSSDTAPSGREATEPAPAAASAPPPSPALRRFKDMPQAYRAEFPALSVDVHAYNADPQRRFVLISGKRYREGDTLAEGPRVAEIVPDGLVLDWRGERLLHTLNR